MRHTQGQLRLLGDASIIDEKDNILVNIFEDKTTPDDARRFVACWNVCLGFDTASLENIDMVDDTFKDRFMGLQEELRAVPLAPDHKGMMVNYSGMLRQTINALPRSYSFQAEMLRQFQKHIEEMGKRFYSGDLKAVDEFLQLYCVADEDRRRVVAGRHKEAA